MRTFSSRFFVLLLLLAVLTAALATLVLVELGADAGLPALPVFAVLLLAMLINAIVAAVMAATKIVGSQAVTSMPHSQREAANSPHSDNDAGAETGEVKWFNSNKGYGFIMRGNGEEIFVHYRSLQGENRQLKPGQKVAFSVVESDRGVQAQNVAIIESVA